MKSKLHNLNNELSDSVESYYAEASFTLILSFIVTTHDNRRAEINGRNFYGSDRGCHYKGQNCGPVAFASRSDFSNRRPVASVPLFSRCVLLRAHRFGTSTNILSVIDLARLVCAFTPTLCSDYNLMTRLIQSIARAAELHLPWGTPLDKHRDINTLLLLRVAANMLHEGTSPSSLGWASTVCRYARDIIYVKFT
jgi:hypothetical protein